MINDLKKFIDGLQAFLNLLFGGHAPDFLLPLIGWIIAFGIILFGLLKIMEIAKKLRDEFIVPAFANPATKLLMLKRKTFLENVILTQLYRLNSRETWDDFQFVELEAEVEIERKGLLTKLFPNFVQRRLLRREKSLSLAVEKSNERLVLLEGEPGSGKSVALRHVALLLANEAHKSKNIRVPIPVYVNLRDLKKEQDESVDVALIQDFILKSLNPGNDRNISEFLKEGFEQGLIDESWIFLFDSFDEIPDVLKSTDVGDELEMYAKAIDDFMGGFNNCRAVVASREYKSPKKHLVWPTFKILRLSRSKQKKLIAQIGLNKTQETDLIRVIQTGSSDFESISSNPFYLSLLCKYLQGHQGKLPKHTNDIFEYYIESLMVNLPKEARLNAEKIAYCMNRHAEIGLNPTVQQIATALEEEGLEIYKLDVLLSDLDSSRIGRSATDTFLSNQVRFSFSHRRYQEYFATKYIIEHPQLFDPNALLASSQWRESTVVLLQNQISVFTDAILRTAQQLLQPAVDKFDYETGKWPREVLHIMGILQDGFIYNLSNLPAEISSIADQILEPIFRTGSILDRKRVLEVVGVTSTQIRQSVLEETIGSKSQWLQDVAFQQAARFGTASRNFIDGIRRVIIKKGFTKEYWISQPPIFHTREK